MTTPGGRPTLGPMRPPVVIASTATPAEADMLAAHLRAQGIAAAARTNLDRTAYAGLGGAMVQVPADQRVEAELELLLLEESAADLDGVGLDGEEDHLALRRHRRTWVRVASVAALAGMLTMVLVPSLRIIWYQLGG
jgi:hypothetical protein